MLKIILQCFYISDHRPFPKTFTTIHAQIALGSGNRPVKFQKANSLSQQVHNLMSGNTALEPSRKIARILIT